tara:strand:- start:848 stop:997 length:150 start_codon:yes stop_codon:yes gene_type:complete
MNKEQPENTPKKPTTLKEAAVNEAEARKLHNQNVNIPSNAWRKKNFYHR